jgi:hypothetical protein
MNNLTWIRQFNEIFDKINKTDTPSYFSGPRFFKVIKEFDPTYADYNQYIDYRRKNKLSDSRKVYFF